MFGNLGSTGIRFLLGKPGIVCAIIWGAMTCPSALAQPRVAVIGGAAAPVWCDLIRTEGFNCDDHPLSGPAGPLDTYVVVIDLTADWADPDGELAAVMRAGRGVVTFQLVPQALGINTYSIVQAWIGANHFDGGTNRLLTVATDPMLGDLPVGSTLLGFNAAGWSALGDTTGHPGAKVLARFSSGTGSVGILRNSWEGGNSVYFTGAIWPDNPLHNDIILNTVRELAAASIPTVSHWGMALSALLLITAGSIVIHRRRGRYA